MLVLQTCTDPLQVLPGSSIETCAISSDGACDISSIKDEVIVVEEDFVSISEESDIGIKQEEVPQDITFPDIKAEPEEVCYGCICL